MNSFIYKTIFAIILSLLLSWAYLFMPQAFFSIDNRLRDFMFIIRGELPKNNHVVIIDIDEKALKEYGQWPWSRDIVADMLYKLSDAGAGIIGLDIVFAEQDNSSPHRFSQKYPEIKVQLPNYDEMLAECFSQTPVVGGYVFVFNENDKETTPMIPAVFIQKGGAKKNTILEPKGIVPNIEILQDSFYTSGFFNNIPDEGGMIRSVPLIMKYDDMIYPSLALEMLRVYSQSNKVYVYEDEAGVVGINMGEFTIPTDRVARLIVNFRGEGKHFKYISAADIISGNFNQKDIENKFILVGTSAVGLSDLRSIPFDSAIAGVEVHANAIDNILSGDYLQKPADIVIYDLIIIWLIVSLFILIFTFMRSWYILPVAIISLYALFELFYTILFEYGIVLNLLFPFIAYTLTLILTVGIDYIIASRQKDEVKRMLGKKVSPAVMEYLLEHSQEELIESKEVEVTILFSDIRSFTNISEQIGSPDKLIRMLNTYMTPMVNNIITHNGTIDKFIGDAIMAYWNAPIKVANHADEAVASAIEQIEMLIDVNKAITPEYDVNIDIGIGLHTGVVTAGDMGAFGRSDYTIIGDNVNLASRLEGLTKVYGAQILISHATFLLLKNRYKIRPIDLVEVKGKNEAVEIHEVICSNKVISDEELELYTKAVELFRASDIDAAYRDFIYLQEDNPSTLYKKYIQRCRYFLDNPDIEFTPILKMDTK